jgi:hypothetical protein
MNESRTDVCKKVSGRFPPSEFVKYYSARVESAEAGTKSKTADEQVESTPMWKLKYVQRQGRYHYFRHPCGEHARLNGTPGSREYLYHYLRLLQSTPPPRRAAASASHQPTLRGSTCRAKDSPTSHPVEMRSEPETKRAARLRRFMSKLKVPEDDRAFLREAIDLLAEKRANDRFWDEYLNQPPSQDQRLFRLRKTGWQMDAMLGIEHYAVAGHHVTVKFDRERYEDRYIVTVPTLPDCHSAGNSVQDAINKIAAVIGARKGKVSQ